MALGMTLEWWTTLEGNTLDGTALEITTLEGNALEGNTLECTTLEGTAE